MRTKIEITVQRCNGATVRQYDDNFGLQVLARAQEKNMELQVTLSHPVTVAG